MEEYVRADEMFQRHRDRRTTQYQLLAAKGNKKFANVLKNPLICDEHGNWRGDMNEAISILSGGRTPKQMERAKTSRS